MEGELLVFLLLVFMLIDLCSCMSSSGCLEMICGLWFHQFHSPSTSLCRVGLVDLLPLHQFRQRVDIIHDRVLIESRILVLKELVGAYCILY